MALLRYFNYNPKSLGQTLVTITRWGQRPGNEVRILNSITVFFFKILCTNSIFWSNLKESLRHISNLGEIFFAGNRLIKSNLTLPVPIPDKEKKLS